MLMHCLKNSINDASLHVLPVKFFYFQELSLLINSRVYSRSYIRGSGEELADFNNRQSKYQVYWHYVTGCYIKSFYSSYSQFATNMSSYIGGPSGGLHMY